jgi:sulfur-carrier protein
MTGQLSVRLFARLREVAGSDAVTVEVPPGTTVGDLRRRLSELWPLAAELVARSAVAVNAEYAADDWTVRPTDEVALIPPVSGGTPERR